MSKVVTEQNKKIIAKKILRSALLIAKSEGWQSLSMRKIAERIHYSAPIIYEHFTGKDDLLAEITRQGFLRLTKMMRKVVIQDERPECQIENLWLAYWDFAITEEYYYQLMLGINMPCYHSCSEKNTLGMIYGIVKEVILKLIPDCNGNEAAITSKFYTYWGMVHGFVSINLIRKPDDYLQARMMLVDMIGVMTRALRT